VHGTVQVTLADSIAVAVRFTAGWSVTPPSMPATIGSRSRALRVLSERVEAAHDRYILSLEGLGGQQYSFVVHAPDEATARSLSAAASNGASATLAATASGADRSVTITFPTTGTNADGYSMTTVTFARGTRP
jgi:hypothetical protein